MATLILGYRLNIKELYFAYSIVQTTSSLQNVQVPSFVTSLH